MLDMKVTGATLRTVSSTYTMTVGRDEASVSVIMAPEADHVKNFYLTWSIYDAIFVLLTSLFYQIYNLSKLCREQIKRSYYSSIGTEAILFHHLLVVHCVSYIYICWIWDIVTSWVEIYYVRFIFIIIMR